jgi:acyl carrier protein
VSSAAVVENAIASFIIDNFLFGDKSAAPAADLPLVQSGLIDSTGILEIVAFLESTFGVYTADDDLAVDNFGSIATIVRFVLAKRAERDRRDHPV